MFREIFKFELGYWFRGWMVFIFTLVLATLFWGAACSENVRIAGAVENTNRNAPYVVQTYYGIASVLTLLMTTAFASGAATRDFANGTDQILFSTPLRKWPFLLGRYLGASVASVAPMLGILLGLFVASFMPWNDPERWGPNQLTPHLMGLVTFAIPNTLLTAAVVFSLAAVTRSATIAFIGAIVLLIAYGFSDALIDNLDNEQLAMLLDPFGLRPFQRMTRYWTISERNTMTLGLSGVLLANRALWLIVSAGVFAVNGCVHSFTERNSKRRRMRAAEDQAADAYEISFDHQALPAVQVAEPAANPMQMVRAQFGVDLRETVFSRVFLVLLALSVINLITVLLVGATEGYGNISLPVTYRVIGAIRGGSYTFLIAIITFYSGVLVWKERESNLDEVFDSLPHPTWTTYIAKLATLLCVILMMTLLSIGIGVVYQAAMGYQRFQLGLYAAELLLVDSYQFALIAVLAMLCHILAPNKYIGYFSFVVFLIGNEFLWFVLDWTSFLVRYAALPNYAYSDFYGFQPFAASLGWFALYWLAIGTLLVLASILFWQRGRETRLSRRWKEARLRCTPRISGAAVLLGASASGIGGWIYFNTHVRNTLRSAEVENDLLADYEKTYRKHLGAPQPRITQVAYDIDLYPERRGIVFRGRQTIENKSQEPISQVHFVLADHFETTLTLPKSKLVTDDKRLKYRIYELHSPMQPGDQREMQFEVRYEARGFEQSVSVMQIMPNGTFFNNTIAPQIGYQPNKELSVRTERRQRGLGAPNRMAELEAECSDHCANTYISNNSDWVDVETTISTSPDQIAIAPGSLEREWIEGGRRYFHYKLDQPSLNFYSFMSARYQVRRDKLGDIDIEVYHHPEHVWNVPKMVEAIRKSLGYYTENFGPYYHRQARIIEFPRYATFAQAYPGTMPYSEGIGFVADLEDEDAIDMVFYVVSHEMAHQWWAHQVIGARMEGATLLSETLAQYSALMVMEREYGRDMMRKFLRYEMDAYLRSRGGDALKEEPLQSVDASQGYVHYRKGSVALYYLKELIGEENVNAALKQLVSEFAYQGPPYPTSLHLIAALREHTPSDKQYLLNDLFERITLFDNRILNAEASKTEDGRYQVTLKFETKKLVADAEGNETAVAMDDFVDVGAFARPEAGREYGRTLYRKRLRLTAGSHEHRFVVDELPDKAGVDPFALLIDRVSADNVTRVTED